MDIKRQPLHFQQSSQNDKNSLKHRWEHLLQTWCPSAASPSWILVLTSSPPHEQLQNSNFTKCRTSVIPNLCGIVALHISVVWETQRKWPRPSNSQFIELSTWAWSNSFLSKISVLCWPELLQCSFLILRTKNLNIWRGKVELNWLAHKEVHSAMEAFGAEEFTSLFKWTTSCPFFRVRAISCKSHCKHFKTQPCTVIQKINWWYFPPRKRRNG